MSGSDKIQETKQVQDIIKKEEARIERSAPSALEAEKPINQWSTAGQADMAESPNILVVEGNPDMENIMAEVEKDEPRAKRTGTLNLAGEKNKPDSSASKKAETSGAQTDSPALKKNESIHCCCEKSCRNSISCCERRSNATQRKFFE